MMTDSELIEAQGQLQTIDTEVAALDQAIRDCIDKSREFNDARHEHQRKRTAILKASEDLRKRVVEALVERKRIANEKARAEAEARANAEAEERANRPPEPTVADLMKTVEELKAKLEEKG